MRNTGELVSNHKNVSNHRPLPFFGDEFLAKQDTLSKLTPHWLEAATGMELSDEHLWYSYIGHSIWVKQLGMMIAGMMMQKKQGIDSMEGMPNQIPLDKSKLDKPAHIM